MRCYASTGTSYGPVSVCLSQVYCNGRIELVFGMGASFDLSYAVL